MQVWERECQHALMATMLQEKTDTHTSHLRPLSFFIFMPLYQLSCAIPIVVSCYPRPDHQACAPHRIYTPLRR